MVEFRTHELTKVLSYVNTQQSGQFYTFLFNHFSAHLEIGLTFYYSRIKVPSLTRGCEIYAPQTKMLEG